MERRIKMEIVRVDVCVEEGWRGLNREGAWR